MRGDTFISLSFLNQILSANFLSKLSKLFGGENGDQSGYFDTAQFIESFKSCPYGSMRALSLKFIGKKSKCCSINLCLFQVIK